MTKKNPAIPIWVDDYLADTPGLSLAQHGAYTLLIYHMWRNDGSLDLDIRLFSKLWRISQRSTRIMYNSICGYLVEYGPPQERKVTTKRLQIVFNFVVDQRRKKSDAGKIGAQHRWHKSEKVSEKQQTADASANSNANASAIDKTMRVPIAEPMHILRKKDNNLTTSKVAARARAGYPDGPPHAHDVEPEPDSGTAEQKPDETDPPSKAYLFETEFMRKGGKL